ncbi:hypothetical protein [Prosthecobacter sp.]|uniref:hypothetical protein n=1 Tax=Prosthecobacter sp. TaxID=1965333 RepID=UPI0037848509
MAAAALRGAAMEPSDFRLWPHIKAALKAIVWEALLIYVMCLLGGLEVVQFRVPAWRDFMLAGAVMLTSKRSALQFSWLLQYHPTLVVCWHLPVAGRDICRWARRKHLLSSLTLLPRMAAAAWVWLGFPAVTLAWPSVLCDGMCLWLTMLACVQLYGQTQGLGRMLAKTWNLALIIWGCMMVYAWWWEKSRSHGQSLPSWVLSFCEPLSWAFPPQWAMHATDMRTAFMFTLACLAAGGLIWWRFPDATAFAYDRLGVGVDAEALSDESGDEEAAHAAPPETAEAVPVELLNSIQQANASEASSLSQGWIEKLAFTLMQQRDLAVAPILVCLHPKWSRRWWKGLRVCTLLLLAAYGMLTFGTSLVSADTQVFWIVLVPVVAVVGFTFPASNSIPKATAPWPLAQHGMPFFAGLPITIDELLRISYRVTAARMIAFFALALPVIAAQCILLGHAHFIPTALGAAVILGVSWMVIRPMFIYYRLQQMCRPVRRHRLGNVCSHLLYVPLFFGVLFSVVASVGSFQTHPAWLLIFLPFTACCARGMFAVFHWRARRSRVDWVIDP